MHCTDDVYGRTQSDVASVLYIHVTHFPNKFFDALSLETLAAGKRVSRCQRTESLYLLTHSPRRLHEVHTQSARPRETEFNREDSFTMSHGRGGRLYMYLRRAKDLSEVQPTTRPTHYPT